MADPNEAGVPSHHQQPLENPAVPPSDHHPQPIAPQKRHQHSPGTTMQAPPPTPNPDCFSLSRTPAPSLDPFLPNSPPSLAMMLNEEAAVMNHINNALMEHLQNDKVIERLQSLQTSEQEEEKERKARDRHDRLPNGHKEEIEISPTSSFVNTPSEEQHYTAAQRSDEASIRRNRAYSTGDIGNTATHSLPSPIVSIEAQAFELSDARVRAAASPQKPGSDAQGD